MRFDLNQSQSLVELKKEVTVIQRITGHNYKANAKVYLKFNLYVSNLEHFYGKAISVERNRNMSPLVSMFVDEKCAHTNTS